MHTVGPEALIGRSTLATVRISDLRVSAVHAEISWRAEGFVLLARGGRVVVAGRGARAVVLEPGLRAALAPGVELEVLSVEAGEAPVVPPTMGRNRLRFLVEHGRVRVFQASDAEATLEVSGPAARILALALARADRGTPWGALAAALWPEDAAIRSTPAWTEVDERRLRNRWDQALLSVRRALTAVREQEILLQRQGFVFVELGPLDSVETA